MYYDQLFSDSFCQPSHAIAYHVSRQLAELYPARTMLEGFEYDFDVEEFAKAGRCLLTPEATTHHQFRTSWYDDTGIMTKAGNVWYEVDWQGHALEVVLMHWGEMCGNYYWLIAEDRDVAERFFGAVCAFQPEVEDEVLVYEDGCWSKSEGLFKAIKGATFDNLVLGGSLKQDIRDDLERFFASRETYRAYGIPWKRGVLFIGPPGNGKTHAVKALINALGTPCLYVKSFSAERMIDSSNISRVYERARRIAPCIVVLEDLDSLVDADSRSFFLNELDGFATNAGVVTLATTNHPEKLDPAIIDRPSRFDRKYHFGLPVASERLAYLGVWSDSLQPALRLSEAGQALIVDRTEGFSFAYLKELFLASMMAWLASPDPGTMDTVMAEQATALCAQMCSQPSPGTDAKDAATEAIR